MPGPHAINILIHVGAGVLALAVGALMLARTKGTAAHKRWGRVFYGFCGVVVATAAVGALVFRPDVALGAITVLVAYLLASGWRALKLRGARPAAIDIVLALAALAVGLALSVAVSRGVAAIWKPAVVRPIAGALVFWGLFDLARGAAPAAWRRSGWRLEHGVKLVNAVTGLASAGVGTLAPDAKPWSQIGPSLVMTLWLVLYLVLYGRRYWGSGPPARGAS